MLEDYLRHVARTGDSVFPWPKVRPLLKRKLDLIADQYCQLCPPEKIPAMPNVDPFKYEQLRTEIHFRIDSLNGSVVRSFLQAGRRNSTLAQAPQLFGC